MEETKTIEQDLRSVKIADGIIDQIKIVDNSLSDKQVLNLAIYTAHQMRSVIPMYIGNLNPKWRLFDSVIDILNSRL